ncbi:hypothetical protein DFH94DRAFT_793019 [Russula ochroleuca]|uniref:Uncharacterized protein n=1 Tax=Russula ochroleuca TaxID=152965 RepID=A0A9P5TAK3_9AGAM|nr:hypothetical protein DFH94DRAFT_793019 [Russula ochroleuca]
MGKSNAEVIALFNQQVNMTADELETWLDDPQSRDAGTGVGIESGRRIVEILRKNPSKKPDAYDEEDMAHIRKVVGYNSRHLAQEDHLKETKTTAELAKAKSTISLKNWGHVRLDRGLGPGRGLTHPTGPRESQATARNRDFSKGRCS